METNIYNLFDFIQKKHAEYSIPSKVKFIYDSDSLTSNDLYIDGDLNFSSKKLTTLPDNLTVTGNMNITGTSITKLGNSLTVGKHLSVYNNPLLESIPLNLKVKGQISFVKSKITEIPDNFRCNNTFIVSGTGLNKIPNNLYVNGDFILYDTPIAQQYTADEIKKLIKSLGGYIKGKIKN
jgi:hypothetical protein